MYTSSCCVNGRHLRAVCSYRLPYHRYNSSCCVLVSSAVPFFVLCATYVSLMPYAHALNYPLCLLSLCSGAKVGTVDLWLVKGSASGSPGSSSTSEELVSHVTSLEGHPAPITQLVFCEKASLLASGCKAGSVRIWDISVSLCLCFKSILLFIFVTVKHDLRANRAVSRPDIDITVHVCRIIPY